jgi:[ribosomal protein S5]-alanine N-acetyltransferase
MATDITVRFAPPRQACILTLPHCRLRTFRNTDYPALQRHLSDPLIWRFFSLEAPGTLSERDAENYLVHLHRRPRSINFAAASIDGDEVLGCVNAQFGEGVHARCAEYGGWLARPLWRSGIARSVTVAFVDWLFEARQVLRVHAAPFAANRASIGTLVASGFSFEGRLRCGVFRDGALMDQMQYAKLSPACQTLAMAPTQRRAAVPDPAELQT